MKALERVELIEKISSALQVKFSFVQIDTYLAVYKIASAPNPRDAYNSKRTYVQDRLAGADVNVIRRIADELEIDTHNLIKSPPRNWEGAGSVKAFISHITADKVKAKKLRDVLKPYNIDCFVAHEDIKPTEEWLAEIQKALNTMDFFISIHTKGFSSSLWCQQEVGYAVARNIKIIPIKFDEDPQGFIGKYQALIRGQKKAQNVADDILSILKNDEKTNDVYREKIDPLLSDEEEIPF